MRSSRSISYWDLGATGMFDGILIDEKCLRAVAWARAVPASRRFRGWRQQPDSVLRVSVRKCPVFDAAAKNMAARCFRFFLARICAVFTEICGSQLAALLAPWESH